MGYGNLARECKGFHLQFWVERDATKPKLRSIYQTHKPSATEPLTTTSDTTLVKLVKNELTKSKDPLKVTRFPKFFNLC